MVKSVFPSPDPTSSFFSLVGHWPVGFMGLSVRCLRPKEWVKGGDEMRDGRERHQPLCFCRDHALCTSCSVCLSNDRGVANSKESKTFGLFAFFCGKLFTKYNIVTPLNSRSTVKGLGQTREQTCSSTIWSWLNRLWSSLTY